MDLLLQNLWKTSLEKWDLSKNECPCHTSLVKNVIIHFASVNKLCGLSITGSSIGHKNIMGEKKGTVSIANMVAKVENNED